MHLMYYIDKKRTINHYKYNKNDHSNNYRSPTSRQLMYSDDIIQKEYEKDIFKSQRDFISDTLKQDNTVCNSNTINNLLHDDSPNCKLTSQDDQMFYDRYKRDTSTLQTEIISSAFTEDDLYKT